MEISLSHINQNGELKMVDVGGKPETKRTAIARGEVIMCQETLTKIRDGALKKGDVLAVARIAGLIAAKKTSELIPLCHQVNLSVIDVNLVLDDSLPGIQISAKASAIGKTGVEMEALTAVSVAALTIYDMAKAVEKTMKINNIRLVEKHGGQSGDIVTES